MRSRLAVAIIGWLAVTGSAAMAEVLTEGPALNPASPMGRYLYSPAFFQRMYAAAVAVDRALGIVCVDKYSIKPVSLIVLSPIDLPAGARQATSGSWIYRYDAIRCGASKRDNLMMTIRPGGAAHASILLPGETFASPRLMVDTIPGVVAFASGVLDKGCKDIKIADTAIAQGPHTITQGGKSLAGVWNEEWTVQGCGRQVVAKVTFIPDGRGGTTFVVDK